MVRVAVEALLKGMAGQGDSHQTQGHLPNLIPHVNISGVQHHSLEQRSRRQFATLEELYFRSRQSIPENFHSIPENVLFNK